MDDRGDIVLGWLTKLALTLAVLGVSAFDLISLGSARIQAEDHAQNAVRAASESYAGRADLQAAYDAAVAAVAEHGDTVEAKTFAVAPDGAVTLTVHRTAPTMILEKVEPLRHWASVQSTVVGRPAS